MLTCLLWVRPVPLGTQTPLTYQCGGQVVGKRACAYAVCVCARVLHVRMPCVCARVCVRVAVRTGALQTTCDV